MTDREASRLYIDGVLRTAEGGKVYSVESPANASSAGTAADASHSDVDAAIAAARRAFDETDWSTNLALRTQFLRRWQKAMQDLADAWRERIMAESGCTRLMTHLLHLDKPLEMMSWPITVAEQYEWERELGLALPMGNATRRLVVKEAAGVVGAITPWNVPLQINIAKAASALAAGCTVVLKAAPDTPWAAALMGEAAARAELPPGVFNVITSQDKATLGEQMVTDPRIDVISFTGSTAVGKRIMEAAAPTLKRVFLELGGKSANIILDDADLPTALQTGAGVCFHAGQGCAITTRLLVPRSRYEEAIAMLKDMFEAVPFGDPTSMEQVMGPIVSRAQYDRVLDYVEIGKAEGARLMTGGEGLLAQTGGYYIQPTVFADVSNDMRIAQEEIFGPVLVVIPFEDDDDAVRIANESVYGLSGALQSADPERALRLARRLRVGTTSINGGAYFGPDAPFGGYKQSGVGREMGLEGFEEFLQTKTIGL